MNSYLGFIRCICRGIMVVCECVCEKKTVIVCVYACVCLCVCVYVEGFTCWFGRRAPLPPAA